MNLLKKISRYLNRGLIWIGCCLLGAMTFLICANIFLRSVWVPIKGTFELVGYFTAVMMAFAQGYTQMRKGHIAVDIVVLRFSGRARKILDGINCLICTAFFALVSWEIAKYASTLWRTGELTETLQIIYYPFVYAVALGCAVLALVFLVDFLVNVFQGEETAP